MEIVTSQRNPDSAIKWYTPKEWVGRNVATLFEPTQALTADEAQIKYPRSTYYKDCVIATVTVFETQEELDAGTPTSVWLGAKVEGGTYKGAQSLVTTLRAGVGRGVVGEVSQYLIQKTGKYSSCLNPVDGTVIEKISAYVAKRDGGNTTEPPPF